MVNIRRSLARIMVLLLALCLLLPAGCSFAPTRIATTAATLSLTPPASITSTSSETPIIMCTPPWCWEDEVLSCPGICPGGCGHVCATRTPDPASTPTPTFPPLADICTIPTPEPGQADQRFALCASAEQVRVGETIGLAAELIGGSQTSLIDITGQDVDGEGNFSLRTRAGDHFPIPWNNNAHLKLVMSQTHAYQIVLLLEGESPGVVTITLRVIPTVPDIQASITISVLP